MDIFADLSQNLLSPAILFFFLGVLAGVAKSDLSVPDSISRYFALYLMMAIGFKGGVALAQTPQIDGPVIVLGLAGLAFSLTMPVLGYMLLRGTTQFRRDEAAALATHYGSISIVTFAIAIAFLQARNIDYGGYIVAIAALKEAPAILVGLYLAHRAYRAESAGQQQAFTPYLLRDLATNGAVILLLGSLVIGYLTGPVGHDMVAPFLIAPFQGVLCMFLLDMGLVVARQSAGLRRYTFSVWAFAVYFPISGGVLGILVSRALGIDIGTSFLFGVLCASASYIAVPAALKLALPRVEPSVYLPAVLAITFPFNVLIGIPLYFALARTVFGV
ncbi:MAG: sodium-dependent bicarbonate transport family permease [Pseudomonadota bacterium]